MKSRYLPFGIGPHVCIGNTLTLMMLTLKLGKVLDAYQPELGIDQPEVRPEAGIVIRPKGGPKLMVTRYLWTLAPRDCTRSHLPSKLPLLDRA